MHAKRDAADYFIELERFVNHMETLAIPYYYLAPEGLFTEWVDLPYATGWGFGTYAHVQWRIAADHLAMQGSWRKTGSPATLLSTLPPEVLPSDTFRRAVSAQDSSFSNFRNMVTVHSSGAIVLASISGVEEVFAHPISYPVIDGEVVALV